MALDGDVRDGHRLRDAGPGIVATVTLADGIIWIDLGLEATIAPGHARGEGKGHVLGLPHTQVHGLVGKGQTAVRGQAHDHADGISATHITDGDDFALQVAVA